MKDLITAILPVIDLQRGQVVRGVAGRRDTYQPIASQICTSARPAEVALGMRTRLGFADAYVADLDAIAGAVPDWNSYRDIAAAGLRLWVDAGVGNASLATNFIASSEPWIDRVIIGLESLATHEDLSGIVDVIGADRAVFSLDLRQGRPLTKIARWASSAAVIRDVIAAGVRTLIVLDLSAVGVADGPVCAELCSAIHQQHAGIELVSGGGVRSLADIQAILESGCRRVLVSSALHDRRISPPYMN